MWGVNEKKLTPKTFTGTSFFIKTRFKFILPFSKLEFLGFRGDNSRFNRVVGIHRQCRLAFRNGTRAIHFSGTKAPRADVRALRGSLFIVNANAAQIRRPGPSNCTMRKCDNISGCRRFSTRFTNSCHTTPPLP